MLHKTIKMTPNHWEQMFYADMSDKRGQGLINTDSNNRLITHNNYTNSISPTVTVSSSQLI